jgi:ABC-type siderophore export system fused ATPase/permease subunit
MITHLVRGSTILSDAWTFTAHVCVPGCMYVLYKYDDFVTRLELEHKAAINNGADVSRGTSAGAGQYKNLPPA